MPVSRDSRFTRQQFNRLRDLAQQHTGIQVSDDKFEMYYGRLNRVLRSHGLASFDDYLKLVQTDDQAFIEFINAITTNVTAFGREQHHFEHLRDVIKAHGRKDFQIWSAGCSSGEEPYSIVINTHECCTKQRISLSILATDLDTNMLAQGRAGVYPRKAIEPYAQPARLKRFFKKGVGVNEGKVRVKTEYRRLVNFQPLNLIKPWDLQRRFDAIFCRNVMIYFDSEVKARLANQFAERLNPGGLLFLGHSESLHKVTRRFENVGKTIYRKC